MSWWKYAEHISAVMKVSYAKTADYVSYYLGYGDTSDVPQNRTDDEIHEFNEVLQIEKYEDEKQSRRLYQELTFLNRYTVYFGPPTHVIDNIYLGSAHNAAMLTDLQDLNIKAVINVTKEIPNFFPECFQYIRYNLYDNNQHSIEKYLEDGYRQILNHRDNTEGNILIHCYMGASRSASLVIYYLMKTMKHADGNSFTFDDALQFIKKKRAIVNPTFRFTKDLAKSFYIK